MRNASIWMLPQEANHNEREFEDFVDKHGQSLPGTAIIIYLFVIFGIQRAMKKRPRLELRYLLVTWNAILAAFSIIATVRLVPYFLWEINEKGLHHTVCDNHYFDTKPMSYWSYLFTMSKLVELGDTVFVVLRKQKLIFLHYYHHITVLLFVFYSYPLKPGNCRWFMIMNFVVHSLMYSYYMLKALKVPVPKVISKWITTLQLLQMVVGVSINIYQVQVLRQGIDCVVTSGHITVAFLMYFSYALLFAKFFYDSYINVGKVKKT